MRLWGPMVVVAVAASQRDELIRPGVGIGKVRLGMTEAQVRGLLGKPFASRSKREASDASASSCSSRRAIRS